MKHKLVDENCWGLRVAGSKGRKIEKLPGLGALRTPKSSFEGGAIHTHWEIFRGLRKLFLQTSCITGNLPHRKGGKVDETKHQ